MRVLPIGLVLAASAAAGAPAHAQTPDERPPLVVPVDVELVQVDAVVTDKKGRYVTDLRAEDFEIVEDGKARRVANFRYVETSVLPPDAPAAAHAPGLSALPPADARALVIVFDDLSLEFESYLRAREALLRLVDERLAPGELVSVIRTSGGVGNLQQFTADKRLLKAAIAGIPYNLGRWGALAPSRFLEGGSEPAAAAPTDPGGAALAAMQARLDALIARHEKEREEVFVSAMMDQLEGVLRSLARMPGRKSLLFVSEGFGIPRPLGRLQEITDTANRASVVIYTLNPGGLRTLRATASDMVPGTAATGALRYAAERDRLLRAGPESLALETGGFALQDTNDLDGAVDRVFEDLRGYYLLGFEPDVSASGRRGVHEVSVKAKRSGLRVRSRRSFYARNAPGGVEPDDGRLVTTLASPFAATDVPVRLTALFHHDPPKGAFVRTLVHIDAEALTFVKDPDGVMATQVEAAALAIGTRGKPAGEAGGTYRLRFTPREAVAARKGGLVLTLDIAVEPGAYQVRAAARDVASGRAGSAYQFIEVPDVAKGRLALSGIVMSGADASPGADLAPESLPAVRRFGSGERVAYGFAVYNARRERAAGTAGLDVQVGLVRDGVLVGAAPGPAVSVPTTEGAVPVAGALRLAPHLQPGLYTLQVIVSDPARPAKSREALQQIDFEVTGAPESARATARPQ
jgi:VWFA-related protein